MKLFQKISYILFASFFSISTFAANFSTPENAIKSLESAYINKDIVTAVAARDFLNEAKLMLRNINPDYVNDSKILNQTTEILELSFRKELKEKGFPNFSNLKCTLAKPKNISSSLVKVTETCIFPDGGQSVEDLHVFKSEKGWRVVNTP